MTCPKCSSDNISINMIQTSGRTASHGTGLGGNTNNAARTMTALTTFGMSNLFWKKSKGTEKMKYKNEKMALCQSCGNNWKVR